MAQISTEESMSSWQRKVFLASQYVMSDSNSEDESDYYSFHSNNMDNTSNRCATWFEEPDCSSCETKVLLRWARILFYKVARTYMAAPLLLALLPLCIGLLVGLWAGTRWERNHTTKKPVIVRKNIEQGNSGAWSFWIFNTVCKHMPFVQRESLEGKENRVRTDLKSDANTARESGVELKYVPKHVAVIMDGNRRYGKARYGNVAKVCRKRKCPTCDVAVPCAQIHSTKHHDPSTVGSLGWIQDTG